MTRFGWIIAIAVVLAVGFLSLSLSAQATDPANGTWELNVAKSTFATGPAPKSETRTIEVVGERMKFTDKELDAAGKSIVTQFTANLDGKDYPITGSPDSDTISLKRIDLSTTESIQKKAGKVVFRNRRVVSADGKVMTLTAQGTDAKGKSVTNVLVFDKR